MLWLIVGLNNLIVVGDYLSLLANKALKSLQGVENLSTVGSYISLVLNDSLRNISAIENLNTSNFLNLVIRDNISLSDCEIHSICNYLQNSNSIAMISGNGNDCMTRDEIEAECNSPPNCFTQTINY